MHFLILLSALVACAAGVPFNTTISTQDERIVGGKPTTIEWHPHQVALLYYGSLWCGGSIISPTHIVTAAHCVVGINAYYLKVRTCATCHASGGTLHNVTGGYYHGGYTGPPRHDYDVAVLFIDPPITYSKCAKPITLQDSEMFPGTSVFVTGWGYTATGGPISPCLLQAKTKVMDYCTCNAIWGGITDRMICAGTPYGGKGPCNGDSGGPLTTIIKPRKLVGIVSWGPSHCGLCGYPAVYTKVYAVRDWILYVCSILRVPKGIIKADAFP